jgi:hypothetical protein
LSELQAAGYNHDENQIKEEHWGRVERIDPGERLTWANRITEKFQ